MKWLIPILAVALCCLFVGGMVAVIEINQLKPENNPPVLGAVDAPGSPVYSNGNIQVFLKVQDPSETIQGESQDTKHLGWIEVDAYNWTAAAQQSNGRITGLYSPGNFEVIAETSKATPKLFQDGVSGKPLTVTIAVQSTDSSGNAVDICTWKLSNAVVTSFNTNYGVDGTSRIYDVYNFMPARVEVTVQPVNSDGSLGSPTSAQWDYTAPRT
jgi:type VI secretion system secreted protein Hcp